MRYETEMRNFVRRTLQRTGVNHGPFIVATADCLDSFFHYVCVRRFASACTYSLASTTKSCGHLETLSHTPMVHPKQHRLVVASANISQRIISLNRVRTEHLDPAATRIGQLFTLEEFLPRGCAGGGSNYPLRWLIFNCLTVTAGLWWDTLGLGLPLSTTK